MSFPSRLKNITTDDRVIFLRGKNIPWLYLVKDYQKIVKSVPCEKYNDVTLSDYPITFNLTKKDKNNLVKKLINQYKNKKYNHVLYTINE